MATEKRIEKLVSKRDRLLSELALYGNFIKGSITSICAKCKRGKCICPEKTSKRNYRLTYKDKLQKTKIVYIPDSKLDEAESLRLNYSKVKKILDEITSANLEIFRNRE